MKTHNHIDIFFTSLSPNFTKTVTKLYMNGVMEGANADYDPELWFIPILLGKSFKVKQ